MSNLHISPGVDGRVQIAVTDDSGVAVASPVILEQADVLRILEVAAHKDALHVLPTLQDFLAEGRPKIQPLWGYVTGVKALVDQARIEQATRAGLDLAHEMQAAMAAAHNDLADGILAAKAAYAGRDPYESQPRA